MIHNVEFCCESAGDEFGRETFTAGNREIFRYTAKYHVNLGQQTVTERMPLRYSALSSTDCYRLVRYGSITVRYGSITVS